MSAAARATGGPVIDMWAPIVPSREIAAHVAENFPPAMHGYLRVFFGREASGESFKAMARTLARDDAADPRRSGRRGHPQDADHGLRRDLHGRVRLRQQRVRGGDRRSPSGSLPCLRRDRHPARRGRRARARALDPPARLSRAQPAALHDRLSRLGPPLPSVLREVRRARRARQHARLRELDHRSRRATSATRAISTRSPATSRTWC